MQQVLASSSFKVGVTGVVLALGITVAVVAAPSSSAAEATKHGYVTTELVFPGTNTEVNSYSRDVDGDGDSENRMGSFFATMYQHGVNSLQANTNESIDFGNLVMLHSLRAPSLANTKNATWQVLYGEPTEDPDFSGAGSFTVDDEAPRSLRLPATISQHRVKTAAGVVPIQLDAGIGVFSLNMKKAKISGECYQAGCSDGAIRGAIATQQIKMVLIPQLVEAWNAIVLRDCPGSTPPDYGCMAESEGKALLDFFDGDEDGAITAEEIKTNPMLGSFLKADLDLAGKDGKKDAVSLGFGFEAARAQLMGGG